MSKPPGDPCLPQACAIQDCLKKSNYQESKCQDIIDKLYLCCKSFYENDPKGETPCCPKPSNLKYKLADLERRKGPL